MGFIQIKLAETHCRLTKNSVADVVLPNKVLKKLLIHAGLIDNLGKEIKCLHATC